MARKVDFQKRHYEFIAKIIFNYKPSEITGLDHRYSTAIREDLANQVAKELKQTNPQFSEDKFITYATKGHY